MSKTNRILHVVGAMNRGGTETMLMNLYRQLDRDELQFDFISYSQSEAHYDKEIERLGGNIYRLDKTNSIKQLYHVIKQHGPYQAVHAHTLYHSGIALIAAFLAGVKIRIAHAHTTEDHDESLLRRMYMRQMRLVINQLSTHLLACSRSAGAFLFGEKTLKKSKYMYFPNVIEGNKFLHVSSEAIKMFKREQSLEDQFVMGHIGTFKQTKNQAFLIDILEELNKKQPTTLVLVGDGELKQQVKTKAKEKKLTNHVRFLGVREDVATIMHSIDLFLLPSIYEGLGMVLLEAQVSGVPCLVSEAIQPEADLGYCLVTKKALTAGPKVWANKIIDLTKVKKESYDNDYIRTNFETSGHAVENGLATLLNLYQVKIGGKHETSIDCVI